MKCPVCVEEDKRSKVYGGVGMTTAAYYEPFYDEDGEYHHHDSNAHTAQYRCSNGHKFTVTTRGKCWCGWTGGDDVVKVLECEVAIPI